MSATPIIPGALYRVRGMGQSINIIADHGCTACLIALELLA